MDNFCAASLEALNSLGCEIQDSSKFWISCPGTYLHTKPTRIGDCKLFFNPNGSVVAHCFHSSCEPKIRELNERLRLANKSTHLSGYGLTATQGSTPLQGEVDSRLRSVAGDLIKAFAWPVSAIRAASPTRVHDPPSEHWRYILKLFRPDDIVWCGPHTGCSGTERSRRWFRPAWDWLREARCPGAFTCPSIFHPGTYSRANRNVMKRRFLVVESDSLSRDEVGAVFRIMTEKLGLQLRAVVDTAGKSLHGWFDYPGDEAARHLLQALPQLGCDPAMFKLSQPCRLPGWLRNENYQHLIYLNSRTINQ